MQTLNTEFCNSVNKRFEIQNVRLITQNLSTFGLNPAEWEIFKNQDFNFLVRNRDDKNFYFKGDLDPKNLNKILQLEIIDSE